MKIKIPFSQEDIEDLQAGEVLEWNMGGHDLYIYNQDRHELLCEEEDCFELQGDDGEYCEKHSN